MTETQRANARHAIKELLMQYCDPKPSWDGLTAWALAEVILDKIEEVTE